MPVDRYVTQLIAWSLAGRDVHDPVDWKLTKEAHTQRVHASQKPSGNKVLHALR